MSDLFMDTHQKSQNGASQFGNGVLYSNSSLVDSDEANEAEDEIANILSLKLRKPKHWKWELSTSRSCTNIALPRILLYDHKGRLLVDANSQDEQVYSQPVEKSRSRKRTSRAATTNLTHSIHQTLNQEFDGLQIQEATPSLCSPTTSTHHTRNSSPAGTSSSCIDFYTNDLPDYKIGRHSSSLKSVRFQDDKPKSTSNSFQFGDLPTPPPSSGTTPTTSSSGPREKRRYRRSQSSGRSPVNSPSILERFSFNKGRFSSPEYAVEHEVHHAPRYFLRTSKAGTLVVQEESFSRCRRRRLRPKHSSSENIRNEISPNQSITSLKKAGSLSSQQLKLGEDIDAAVSLEDVCENTNNRRKRYLSARRHRSDGNILIQSTLSSSEEETKNNFIREDIRPQRKYGNLKRHLKGVTIHPENDVSHPYGSPTER